MSKSGRPPVDPREVQLNGPTDLDRQRIRDGIERAMNRGAASATVLRVDAAMGERALRNAGVSSPEPDTATGWASSKLTAAKIVLPALLIGAAAGVFLGKVPHHVAPAPPPNRSLPVQVEDLDEPSLPRFTEPAQIEPPAATHKTRTRSAHHAVPHPSANAHAAGHDRAPRTHETADRDFDISAIATPPTVAPPTSASTPAHHLAEELRLMRAASSAMAENDYARALNLLSDHAERYHDGALAEERHALRVISLCKQGLSHFALTERDEFFKLVPHSPLAARVREACQVQP